MNDKLQLKMGKYKINYINNISQEQQMKNINCE